MTELTHSVSGAYTVRCGAELGTNAIKTTFHSGRGGERQINIRPESRARMTSCGQYCESVCHRTAQLVKYLLLAQAVISGS